MDDLTPEEAAALKALAAREEVPESLADRTVARLRVEGLLERRGGRRWARLLAAAAGVALFAAGLFVGERRGGAPVAVPKASQYALFLYDAPDEPRLTPDQMGRRVEEYRNWARQVRREGGQITGEKLESRGELLGEPIAGPGARPLGGYFVIGARDDAAALAVARSCPHLKHGGSILVRPIAKI